MAPTENFEQEKRAVCGSMWLASGVSTVRLVHRTLTMVKMSVSSTYEWTQLSIMSPMIMLLLLVQSHSWISAMVAADDKCDNNNSDSRRTTTTSSVTYKTSSVFVFRDCGEQQYFFV